MAVRLKLVNCKELHTESNVEVYIQVDSTIAIQVTSYCDLQNSKSMLADRNNITKYNIMFQANETYTTFSKALLNADKKHLVYLAVAVRRAGVKQICAALCYFTFVVDRISNLASFCLSVHQKLIRDCAYRWTLRL